jgi:hypothetical protein
MSGIHTVVGSTLNDCKIIEMLPVRLVVKMVKLTKYIDLIGNFKIKLYFISKYRKNVLALSVNM